MGRNAVVPLIEALNTKNPFLKQQVAILLGHIKDIRALPDLKKILENPREKKEVKKYVALAVERIARRKPIALSSAKKLYYRKALAYYRNKEGYRPILTFNWLFWKWQDNQLVSQVIPEFSYNEIMAEQACYNALAIDANMKKVWALLARIYYSQYTEVTAIEKAVKEKGLDLLPEKEMNTFLKEKPFATKAKKLSLQLVPAFYMKP